MPGKIDIKFNLEDSRTPIQPIESCDNITVEELRIQYKDFAVSNDLDGYQHEKTVSSFTARMAVESYVMDRLMADPAVATDYQGVKVKAKDILTNDVYRYVVTIDMEPVVRAQEVKG